MRFLFNCLQLQGLGEYANVLVNQRALMVRALENKRLTEVCSGKFTVFHYVLLVVFWQTVKPKTIFTFVHFFE